MDQVRGWDGRRGRVEGKEVLLVVGRLGRLEEEGGELVHWHFERVGKGLRRLL